MAALSARLRGQGAAPLLLREFHGREALAGRSPNLLVEADNLALLRRLRSGPLREYAESLGGLKLAYLDPPFAVGADFYTDAAYGGPRVLAYSDYWPGGLAGYLDMMGERLTLLREVLASDGCLFLHCDSRASHHLRLLLDEIFGPERFLGEIIWHYTGGGRARRWFSRKHDSIFHYAVSGTWTFDPDAVRVPYSPGSGYARSGITSARGKRYLPHPLGTPVDDVWDIPMVNPLAAERTGYPTQKPLALLERILVACSRPGDLTADFFCGSGALAEAASRLGRAWICADQSPLAVQTAKRRLLAMREAPGFVLAGENGVAEKSRAARKRGPRGEMDAAEENGPLEKGRAAGKNGVASEGGANGRLSVAGECDAAGESFFRARAPGGSVRYRLRPRLRCREREADKSPASLPAPKPGKAFSVLIESLDVEIDGPLPDGAHVPAPGLCWLRSWGLGRAAGPDLATPWLDVDFLSREAIWQTPDCLGPHRVGPDSPGPDSPGPSCPGPDSPGPDSPGPSCPDQAPPLSSPELPCGREPLIAWLTDIFGNTTCLRLDESFFLHRESHE